MNPSPGQGGHATPKRLPTLERAASVLPSLHQRVRAGGYPHDRDCSEAGKLSCCVHRGQPELPSALPIYGKRRSIPCRLCLLSRPLRSGGGQRSACQLTGRLRPAFPEIHGTEPVSGWRVVRFYWNEPDGPSSSSPVRSPGTVTVSNYPGGPTRSRLLGRNRRAASQCSNIERAEAYRSC